MPQDKDAADPDWYEVCALVMLAHPEDFSQVKTTLKSIPGVEIHAQDPSGKLALTIEDTEPHRTPHITEKIAALHNIPGVIDVALAFSHCENLARNSSAVTLSKRP